MDLQTIFTVIYLFCVCICVYVGACMCQGVHVLLRGQFAGLGFILPLYGFQKSNWDYQACVTSLSSYLSR